MTLNLQQAQAFAHSHRSRYLDLLGALVNIPSISTDPDHRTDMLQAAGWLCDYLAAIGMQQVHQYPPETHPLVYAENLSAGPPAPTVLIYGHYDVQPAEPLEKWTSDPFSATIRGDNLFGRGGSDMKGNLLSTIFAVEACLENGGLPVNVKFFIEGQEEIGSPALGTFMQENRDIFAADICLNTDTGMLSINQPTITYALRGLAYFELRLTGPQQDLHSGLFGGAVHNPAQALAELLAGMHDQDGRVTLPGFYDDVRPLTPEERQKLAAIPVREQDLIDRTGIPKTWGEREFSFYERITARPTLEVNGMLAGFTGGGSKTVIPSKAMAKISCRLVPDQSPVQIRACLEAYLKAAAPETVHWELNELVSGFPSISNTDSHWIQAMIQAQTQAFGVPPLFRREGGSVPVVADLQQIIGMESINIGIGLPDDNQHGPNEKMHIPSFHRQIDCLIRFFSILEDMKPTAPQA